MTTAQRIPVTGLRNLAENQPRSPHRARFSPPELRGPLKPEACLAALEVYYAAQRSGRGAGLDGLVDRVSKRFTARRTGSEAPFPAEG